MIIKLKKTLDVVIQIFIDQYFNEEKQKRIMLEILWRKSIRAPFVDTDNSPVDINIKLIRGTKKRWNWG